MFSATLALVVLNLSLGGAIVFRAYRDRGAIIFFLITLVFSFLSIANYFSLSNDPNTALFWIRIEMFLAAWHTFLFFAFVHLFGKSGYPYTTARSLVFIIPFAAMLYISISPHLFSGIEVNAATGSMETSIGYLFPLFAFWLLGTMLLSMITVVRTFLASSGVGREQWRWLLTGAFATYTMLILSNFIFAGILHNTDYLKYTPLYSVPIMVAIAYAVVKHELFNIKVVAAEAFVAIISVIYFAKIFTSSSMNDRIIDVLIFLATFSFGILLVRSVKEEIASREKIQSLANTLSETNWELAKKNEQLRVIDQRKSEFVSIVSHQLRTPITAIKGYSSLLLEGTYGNIPQELHDPLEKIFLSSDRLATMVSEFLDISKIEQGTMAYNFIRFDIRKTLVELVGELRPRAAEKKLSLDLDPGADEPLPIVADEGKLRQIVSNLIDNAIKYTVTGGITVSLLHDREKKRVICRIKDTGVGLSQDDIHHLFGKFTRGSEGSKMNTGGSGLGLYVAKKMLEAHKGTVWVDSEGAGRGSVFVIELLASDHPDSPLIGRITQAGEKKDENETSPLAPAPSPFALSETVTGPVGSSAASQ